MQWNKITDCGTHAWKASRDNRYILITNAEDPEWSLDDAEDYTVGFYADEDCTEQSTVITLEEAKARGERYLNTCPHCGVWTPHDTAEIWCLGDQAKPKSLAIECHTCMKVQVQHLTGGRPTDDPAEADPIHITCTVCECARPLLLEDL